MDIFCFYLCLSASTYIMFQVCVNSTTNLPLRWNNQQKRSLSVHEYLSMKILNDLDIKVPNGKVARTPDEAYEAAKELGKE